MTLFASAGTLDQIRESISDFYCGTSMTLIPTGDDSWKLVRTSDGKNIEGVHVKRKRNRLRFETVDSASP